jgi:hypothetical protein
MGRQDHPNDEREVGAEIPESAGKLVAVESKAAPARDGATDIAETDVLLGP